MSRFSRYSNEEEKSYQRRIMPKVGHSIDRPQLEKSIKVDSETYQQLTDLKQLTGRSMKYLLHQSVAGYYEQETAHDR
ncbi:hypothetical protein [Fructobacillus evanidus]|uniref:Uncharacterized protein n=1 Tax=Fructobacillus evanidus TaxID=3064281 RepID=A0ABN9YUD4_9LACO|nr:unnamed protein product [Fructobacillus sp. LMG 32999]CAK1229217.1 unnamed protein product [Fructobacillus sp. LMG 32999]CAK1231404.1 unnamed protein product [Fructobacillus sp. LMG 32999]CAK1231513.1 unnamed protein product [Fructobacillus sp. LMG 32999]CAK1232616.1 unnamed protein product [Fructobacillus sp. LMG 32999]